MTHALVVDSVAREVREIELPDNHVERLVTLNDAIGGYLETAYVWPTGDVLFVNEDGGRHDWRTGFGFLPRFGQFERVFRGNGVVVGREVSGTEDWANLSTVITAHELRKFVRFVRLGPSGV